MDPTKAPGWNDPPILSYSATLQHSNSPKRNILNKRVPFPVNSSSLRSADSIPSASCFPTPTPVLSPSISSALYIPNNENQKAPELPPVGIGENLSSEDMLAEILNDVDSLLVAKKDFLQNKEELIRKKIHTMEELWTTRLPFEVKNKIYKLSKDLINGDLRTANETQASLIIDHPKICSEFIPAFRQLINLK